jgi:hypothetical protein
MPLLTVAMADVPMADAGLGSGIVNVSQQVSGALGLAVLGTLATNHSKVLAAAGHSLTSSLLGGYHLAFAIGAVCLAFGIVAALVVLRPLERRALPRHSGTPEPVAMREPAAVAEPELVEAA